MDAIEALRSFSAQPAPLFEPTDADAFANPVFGRALGAVRPSAPPERNAVLEALAEAIPAAADGYQAARLAMICGTIVEWGADPAIPGPAILDRLIHELGAWGRGEPAVAERSVRFLCVAAMAVLCRDPALRHRLRATPDLERLLDATDVAEIGFVQTIASLTDDLELTVIHLDRREGARVRLNAVATCFHLLTLLQDAFPAWCGDDPVDPEVAAIARGEATEYGRVTDHARFHLYDWSGLPAEGQSPHFGATVWGEAPPSDIPALDGVRYVLVGELPLGGRSWDSGFFANIHDALRSGVEIVEALPPERVDAALAAIRTAVDALPPTPS